MLDERPLFNYSMGWINCRINCYKGRAIKRKRRSKLRIYGGWLVLGWMDGWSGVKCQCLTGVMVQRSVLVEITIMS